jgi:hypothetical protein
MRATILRIDTLRFSNPRTQEEEEKTGNIWMKGHAGNDWSSRTPLIRTSHDACCRPHKFHGNMESTRHSFANQGLGWSMALCQTCRERSRKSRCLKL